jgi:16S rRNA (cytosine967-C5)-methyltransferase
VTKPATGDDAARRTAYDVLLAVDTEAAYGNLLLPSLLRSRRLPARDAAFATELAYGCLRWQGVLDEVIAAGARRDVAALDPGVRAVLRLGAYQLLHLRVPAHAAVHSSVELARATSGPKVTGLVNAVLRRVGERDWPGWVDRLAPRDEVGREAFAAGFPRWVADAWLDRLNGDVAELRLAMAADRPSTHLVARPGRISREALLEQAGAGASAGPWSPYAVHLGGGDPGSLAAVRDGRAGVQDEGSQLAALVLARAELPGPDRRWLDVCAGPGGKAALLGGLLPADGRLLAADLQPHRAGLVASAVTARADVVVADGRRGPWQPGSFDRVLVDAPCTGLGALRRRPEVRWCRTADDAGRMHPLQVDLLCAAVEAARPGGLVAYVTCSPHRLESSQVVADARARHPDLEPVDVRPLLDGIPALGPGPDAQLWTHRHGTDAMYVALLRTALHRGHTGA